MDDGVEGYMSPHTSRQGIPVCRRGNVCGVMNSDQFFATNSAKISGAGRERLTQFFQQTAATSYIITGHTDARASDEYNMKLSYNRASSVARIAQSSGARIATYVATVNVCQQLQTKRHTVCNKTAVSKSSVFVKGIKK